MSAALLSLLHICDSLFPIGAFSHSDGLEAATAPGHVSTPIDFEHWLLTVRDHTLRECEGPGVARAWQACTEAQWGELRRIDDDLRLLRSSSAAREASRAVGNRLIRTWNEIHPEARFLTDVPLKTLPGAFGCVSATAGISQRDALNGFMYTRLAAS